MCGIAGVVRFDGRIVDEATLAGMSQRIAHRGPDGAGTFVSGAVGLAHRRLSILDLSNAAQQPMADPAGKAVLCYNGEIYNYRELRERLSREGCRFHSTGDTEVLLHACLQWGVAEAARQADGMFAFAYWDAACQELWLARDRFGIKPLYYHRSPERVLFASEIKALLGEVTPEPNEPSLMALLMRVPLCDPHTPFAGISAVEPGQAICIRPGGKWEPHRFYSLADAVEPDLYRSLERAGDDEVIARVAELIDHSVLLHLTSDATVGTLASGGLDSNLVTYLSKQHLPEVEAYHADVQGRWSELQWATQLARHADVPLRVATLTPDSFLRALPEVTYANECPIGFHPNTVPFYLVCKLAAESGVKVLLTGEGADELFGGYSAFRANFRRRELSRWKNGLTSALRAVGLGGLARAMDGATSHSAADPATSLNAAIVTRGQALLPVLQAREAYDFVVDPLERAFHADLFNYLHGYLQSILWRNDRMGMAVGVESRVPYLENELVKLVLNLPMRFKLRGRINKWVLRRAAERRLPTALSRRPKMGFPVDAHQYVRPSLNFFRDGFLQDRLRIGTAALRALAEQYGDTYFALVAAEVWGQLFFQGLSPEQSAERLLSATDAGRGLGPWGIVARAGHPLRLRKAG